MPFFCICLMILVLLLNDFVMILHRMLYDLVILRPYIADFAG